MLGRCVEYKKTWSSTIDHMCVSVWLISDFIWSYIIGLNIIVGCTSHWPNFWTSCTFQYFNSIERIICLVSSRSFTNENELYKIWFLCTPKIKLNNLLVFAFAYCLRLIVILIQCNRRKQQANDEEMKILL